MHNWKRRAVFGLRMVGICLLCAALVAVFLRLERGNVAKEAEILFAGTKDDADCAILLSGDACVVIDTGEARDAAHILSLLEGAEVGQIDCLILTHPDQDHIGGAPKILDTLPVKLVICPYYAAQNPSYEALRQQCSDLGIPMLTPARSRVFTYGELSLRVWPPEDFYYEKDNDYSLAVLAEHGQVRLFFAGDAQKQRMQEIQRYRLADIDLYKVSFHGRNLTTGAQLIRSMQPRYAVVTAAAPEEEIRLALEDVGAQILCTRDADVAFRSDGKKLTQQALALSP